MSIDSQIKEMTDLANKEELIIKDIYKESHSAKISGKRPIFMQLLADVENGRCDGILTWAPDRLSRNAGDLGMLVDLMDQEKLVQIRTFSQTFSNNPNEKFLLMILCSQAKLENDQKGLNVKRGIRAKCEMGWRPGPAPLGYINRSFAGVKEISVDPDRAPLIKEMFEKSLSGQSGRSIKKWADTAGLNNKSGKPITLSQIYRMLNDPFYYGEFEYPNGSNNWYQGSHEAIISKGLFEKVRKIIEKKTPKKSKWGAKKFIYKGLFKCGYCKSYVIGEEKYRERKNGKQPRKHIYYHCTRQKDNSCNEPYATEKDIENSFLRFISFVFINHPHKITLTEKLLDSMKKHKDLRDEVLIQQDINPNSKIWDIRDFSKYIMRNGKPEMRKELFKMFDYDFYLKNKQVTTLRAH